jgi:hypothetical protein
LRTDENVCGCTVLLSFFCFLLDQFICVSVFFHRRCWYGIDVFICSVCGLFQMTEPPAVILLSRW